MIEFVFRPTFFEALNVRYLINHCRAWIRQKTIDLRQGLNEELFCCYPRVVLHNLIEAYQEARRWKLQAEGLQHELQTLQDERELSRQKVQTLECHLSVLRYNRRNV